jgi:hypothetical protein
LAVEDSQVKNRAAYTNDDAERGQRWGDDQGHDKTDKSHNDCRKCGASK